MAEISGNFARSDILSGAESLIKRNRGVLWKEIIFLKKGAIFKTINVSQNRRLMFSTGKLGSRE